MCVSQNRQAPDPGPQSGDRLWMCVLCVPTGLGNHKLCCV